MQEFIILQTRIMSGSLGIIISLVVGMGSCIMFHMVPADKAFWGTIGLFAILFVIGLGVMMVRDLFNLKIYFRTGVTFDEAAKKTLFSVVRQQRKSESLM